MSASRSSLPSRSRRRVTATAAAALIAFVMTITTGTIAASGYWHSTGSAAATSTTSTLAEPFDVTVPGSASGDVPVSWSQTGDGLQPTGYYITRKTGGADAAACGSSPTTLIADTDCMDASVPDGTHQYVVTAVFRSWTASSIASSPVEVVNAAQLAFIDQPTDATEGSPLAPPVTVAVQAADGSAFAAEGVPVTIAIAANPSDGELDGELEALTDASGVATFDSLTFDRPGVGYTISASSAGLDPAISDPFTVFAPPLLGAAASFSLLAGTAVVSTGASSVSGDVGVSPGTSVTGFGPGTVGGDIHAGDAIAASAHTAVEDAYDELSALAVDGEIVGNLGGRVLTPGVYHSTAALALTGTLVLDAQGDSDAVFVFQSDAAFDTAAASVVTLVNGATASNVFWVVLGAAGTGANSFLSGSILSQGAITLGAGTELIGRALSLDTVTIAAATIRFTDTLPPSIAIDGGAADVTKDTTPTISGTSDAPVSSAITVAVSGQVMQTSVGADGTWSVIAAALPAGSYNVVAKVRDADGNGNAAGQSLTVEVNPPPIALGIAGTYSVLAGTSVVNTGATSLSGDLGISPGTSITGFPPGTLAGTIHSGDVAASDAQDALQAALDDATSRAPHTEIIGDLGGRAFHAGVHHAAAALAMTGAVTLDGEGDPNAVFIFTTDAAFDTAAASAVLLTNGAQASNVFWVVDGAAGTGANSVLAGTVLAVGAITLGAGTALTGSVLSQGTVTMAASTLTGVSPRADDGSPVAP